MRETMPAPTRQKFNLKEFFGLINQTKPAYWQFGIGLFLGIIGTGIQLFVPKMAGDLINTLKSHVNTELIWLVVGLFIFSAVINAVSGAILGFFGEDVVAKL
ncbi:ABC transporter permease [Secundilactobacillus oryzae JCM 18671]|uniref:ABC transporter permease n=1 Tax=Secundilactobacillus oryzae JCM 18671 TaxID=1291743 RepID=A0A081BGF7_9LACO|nr:ABC transporter permease [Secundilactobacillus oryzae JCM 18671]